VNSSTQISLGVYARRGRLGGALGICSSVKDLGPDGEEVLLPGSVAEVGTGNHASQEGQEVFKGDHAAVHMSLELALKESIQMNSLCS
jgi:hypothetical protein